MHSGIRLAMGRYYHVSLHSLEAAVDGLPPILEGKPTPAVLSATGTEGRAIDPSHESI